MSLCAAALVCAAAFAAAPAQAGDNGVIMKDGVAVPTEPIFLNGGPGIAISGSQNAENMPAKAWNFLKDNYKDNPVAKCTENFVKQTYHVVLADRPPSPSPRTARSATSTRATTPPSPRRLLKPSSPPKPSSTCVMPASSTRSAPSATPARMASASSCSTISRHR